jgi:transcriptional regulator with XRE-family HTH domain
MSKNSKNSFEEEMDDFLAIPPSVSEKAWGLISDFYHLVLTQMENENMTKAGLAKRLGCSRSAVSQILNKTPNITVRKMTEIADAVGLELGLVTVQERNELRAKPKYIYFMKAPDKYEIQEIYDNASALKIGDSELFNEISCKILSHSGNPKNLQ